MDFWGAVAILGVCAIVLRLLRSIFVWVDYVAYAIMFIGPIGVWISEGFGAALVAFFVGAIAVSLLFGVGSKTEIRRFGHKYSLECSECGYGDLKILNEEGDVVVTKCRRCGSVCAHTLNH